MGCVKPLNPGAGGCLNPFDPGASGCLNHFNPGASGRLNPFNPGASGCAPTPEVIHWLLHLTAAKGELRRTYPILGQSGADRRADNTCLTAQERKEIRK